MEIFLRPPAAAVAKGMGWAAFLRVIVVHWQEDRKRSNSTH